MCISANAAGNNVSAQNQLDINKYVQIFKGEDSKVKVFVVPTNEELAIARETVEIVNK